MNNKIIEILNKEVKEDGSHFSNEEKCKMIEDLIKKDLLSAYDNGWNKGYEFAIANSNISPK